MLAALAPTRNKGPLGKRATAGMMPDMAEKSMEETEDFRPKFNADGLIPAVATSAADGQLLMLAYMNEAAVRITIETGEAHYWSRSRGELWRKGATSGNVQRVIEMRTDCDQDAIHLIVEQTGPACHTGRRSCFYRVVDTPEGKRLQFIEVK